MTTRIRQRVQSVSSALERQPWNGQLFLKVWAFSMAVRIADIYVMRPICADTTKPTGFCMPFFGDGTAMYGAAQLVRLGKIGYNPIFYTVSGGQLVPTAAKPPAVVAVLSVVSWIGAAPLWLVVAATSVLAFGLRQVLTSKGLKKQSLLAVQIVIGVVVVLRVVGGDAIDGARLGGAMYAALAAPIVMAYGKRIGGTACGLASGLLVAVSPAIWTNDTGLNVEVAAVVAIALVMLTSQLVVERWSAGTAVCFGLACALAILSRFELVIIVAIASIWLLIRHWRTTRGSDVPSEWRPAVLGIGAFVLCVGGYGAWSVGRIESSSGGLLTPFGLVLSQSACDQVVYGDLKGLYAPCMVEERRFTAPQSMSLAEAVDEITGVDDYGEQLLSADNPTRKLFSGRPPTDVYGGRLSVENYRTIYDGMYQRTPDGSLGLGVWVDDVVSTDPNQMLAPGQVIRFKVNLFFLMVDELLTSQVMERQSMSYLRENAEALPGAVVARIGRVAGVFRTSQSIEVNSKVEGHGVVGTVGGLVFLWVGLLSMPLVMRKMRRNGVALTVLIAPLVQVLVVCGATYGIIRYRLSVDVAVCVILAYGLFGRPLSELHVHDLGSTTGPSVADTRMPTAATGSVGDGPD